MPATGRTVDILTRMTRAGQSFGGCRAVSATRADIFAPDLVAHGFEYIHQTKNADDSVVSGNQQRHEMSGYQLMYGLFQRRTLIDQFLVTWWV
jgi:hypothetical protein